MDDAQELIPGEAETVQPHSAAIKRGRRVNGKHSAKQAQAASPESRRDAKLRTIQQGAVQQNQELSNAASPVGGATALASGVAANLAGRIIVRTPVPQDREPARALCKAMHARTFLADLPFSDKKFDRIADGFFSRPKHAVALVAELDGRLVGLIWATAGEYFLAEQGVLATVHAVAVDRERLLPPLRAKVFLRLLKGLRTWAATRNAQRILVHVTTGRDLRSTDKLLRAAGMMCVGGSYVG